MGNYLQVKYLASTNSALMDVGNVYLSQHNSCIDWQIHVDQYSNKVFVYIFGQT